MKIYSKEEINTLAENEETGNYHLVIHSQDLVKFAQAVAFNAQQGNPKTLEPLSQVWKDAVNKHLAKVFTTYLKQEKILVIKSREDDA